MKDKIDLIFHDVFITGILPEDYTKEQACAAGLCGWANCMAGSNPPEMFGEGMAKIGKFLGVYPTPEEIEKYADMLIKNKPIDNITYEFDGSTYKDIHGITRNK